MIRWFRHLLARLPSYPSQAQAFSKPKLFVKLSLVNPSFPEAQACQAQALPSPSLMLGIELEKLELGASLIKGMPLKMMSYE